MLTEEHKSFFQKNGYVKIEGIVPKENCDRVINAIWEFLGRDRSDSDQWYNPPEGILNTATGMLEMYHHQSMWDNRQHPAIYQAFAELLGETKLWVSIDRVNMKPPARNVSQKKGFIHWDTDTSNLPLPVSKPNWVQGVLYLADTAENQGGFQCVPEIYRELDYYLSVQPADRNPIIPDLTGYKIEAIPGKAGDFLIWDSLLPHGNGPNFTDKPRYAQYIFMNPAQPDNEEERKKRIASWRNRKRSETFAFPGDPRNWESENFNGPPELTPLGRKLLGLDPW